MPSKYHPGLCQEAIKHMRQGLSKAALAGEFEVSRTTVKNWVKKYPEFAEAMEEGQAQSQRWWEQQGIDGMLGDVKGFQAAVWIFNMKNRFNWRDKSDLTSEDGPIQVNIVRYKQKHADKHTS